MAFAKFEENLFRIDGEIAENHAILVNLTASIVCPTVEDGSKWKLAFRYPISQFSSDFHENPIF